MGIEQDLTQDRRHAVESLEEAVYSRSRLNVGKAPRLLAETLFTRLKDAVGKGTEIGEWLSKGTAAKELGTTVTSTSFKNAVRKVARALKACRPDSQSLPPDEDHIGVAAMDTLIGGVPHLVIVRGPTAEYRPGAPEDDDSLRLKVEFRPLAKVESADQAEQAVPLIGSSAYEARADITTRRRRIKLVVSVLIVASVLAISAMLLWSPTSAPPSPRRLTSPPPTTLRPTTAVLTFQNNTNDPDLAWVSTAIAEILLHALSTDETLRVISRDETVKMEMGLRLQEPGTITIESLRRVRKRIHTDSVIVGSYLRLGDSTPALVQIQTTLLDTRTGVRLASSSASGDETHLLEIVMRASAPLRQKLGIGELPSHDKEEVKASIPLSHGALRLYSEGLGRLRRFQPKEAHDLLLQAVASDGKHPLIFAALAESCDALGLSTNARDAIKKARAHERHLSLKQKLHLGAQYYKLDAPFQPPERRKEGAIQLRQLLWKPPAQDAIEDGLELASTQIAAGETDQALITVENLRLRLPSALRDDARIDLLEARAYQELSRYDRQRPLAASAAAKAADDRLLLGSARLLEATALIGLRDLPSAHRAIDEAQSSFQAVGDRGNAARALEQRAAAIGADRDLKGEQELLRQALVIHSELGDRRSVARIRMNMIHKFVREGNNEEAQNGFDQAIHTFSEIGAPYDLAATLNEYAAFKFDRGDLVGAAEQYRKALNIFQDIRDNRGTATALTNIGEVVMYRGDLDGALRLHGDSLKINRGDAGGDPDKAGHAYDLLMIGNIFAIKGDRSSARLNFEQALRMQNEIDANLEAAESKMALAGLLIDDGKASEGYTLAKSAEDILRNGDSLDRSYLALATMAQALLAQGKAKEAKDTGARAWRAVAQSRDRRLRFSVAIPHARTLAASTKPEDVDAALVLLENLRGEAHRTGFVIPEFEIELAIGEIEMSAGRSTGVQHLAALEQAAKQKGIRYIADRAATARQRKNE
jgi:tetratricopeptide (TPR) repeat protein/TolB-like protein